MGRYYRTLEMSAGGPFRCFRCPRLLMLETREDHTLTLACRTCTHHPGGKPFRCYNCGRMLVRRLEGRDVALELECPRCNTVNLVHHEPGVSRVVIRCPQAIPGPAIAAAVP